MISDLTPTHPLVQELDTLHAAKEKNETTPCKKKIRFDINHQTRTAENVKSSKQLNFGSPSSPKSFSLINLHKHLLGFQPHQSHGAEADCLTLLRTTSSLGREWIDWVNENATTFSNSIVLWKKLDKCTFVVVR